MERQEGHTPEPWTYFEDSCAQCEREGTAEFILREPPGAYHGQLSKKADVERICACVNTLAGIPTEALEHLASLPAKERFGALSDIAKLHEMKEGG